jgi:hypothetical protein
LKRSQT